MIDLLFLMQINVVEFFFPLILSFCFCLVLDFFIILIFQVLLSYNIVKDLTKDIFATPRKKKEKKKKERIA